MIESVLRRPSFAAEHDLFVNDPAPVAADDLPPAVHSPHILAHLRALQIESPSSQRINPRSPKQLALVAGLLAAILLAGAASAHYFVVGRFIYSTDDAYVRTDLAIISPKISGYIEAVAVAEHQHVTSGQLLVRLDAGDYRLALDAARGKILTQTATIERIESQMAAQNATIRQAQAQIDSAQAELSRAEADFERVRALAAAKFATRQRLDNSLADRSKAAAASANARAALEGARANLAVLQAQKQEAESAHGELMVAEQRAARDLSFAEIRAPFDGVVGNRAAEPGQLAQPGARLMALAPDAGAYIEANFKETQLDRLAPGQNVAVRVDAYGGRIVDGVVESIAPASGAQFSLLPPENATGNFTKITQRFPVRIRLAPQDRAALRAGLSVVVDVDTRAAAGLSRP